jgi:ABC-type transport system involved in multi-copper enzyme maturation permease subunit
MSTGTMTPYRPAVAPGRDGFGQLLRAEWTKFRTVRGWVIGMLVAALVTAGLGIFAAVGSSSSCSHGPGSPARHGAGCAPTLAIGPGGEAVTDSFFFVRQPLAGHGSITVRVTSLTGQLPVLGGLGTEQPSMRPGLVPWAKAGLIIKDGTRPGSAYAAIMVTGGHGVRMQDNFTQDTAGRPGRVSPASPRWLRLTRSGGTITGYDSADGTHWTQVSTVHLAGLPSTVQAGLFAASPGYQVSSQSFGGGVTSNSGPSQDTAVFDHVSRSGTWTRTGWTGGALGGAEAGSGSYHQAGGQFTVTGSGDVAPVAAGAGGDVGDTTTISNLLVGTFAGLIAVIVVGAMFITAEYRRGMIRTTLAASPRRGRVLAAKAVVIGSAAFVAGLAAAAVAVAVGVQLARDHSYVFPVTWLTDLRVIVGTGVLLAVTAVLALAVGAALRRSAAAVTTVIVVMILPYILGVASVLPAGVSDWLLRLTPAATFAIQQSVPRYSQVTALYSVGTGYYPLAPWAGFAVLCGYTAIALGVAVPLLRRRDA